jgi:hypothetical protein
MRRAGRSAADGDAFAVFKKSIGDFLVAGGRVEVEGGVENQQ